MKNLCTYIILFAIQFSPGLSYEHYRAIYPNAHLANQAAVRANLQGERYHYGYGVPVDYVQARHHYVEAVELGSPVAAHHLGNIYTHGFGVDPDLYEAERWYQRSVEIDPSLENACVNGLCSDRLLAYLVKRATHGDPEAQFELAKIYEFGILGVEIDLKKAHYYYMRSAELHYRPAIEWHRKFIK